MNGKGELICLVDLWKRKWRVMNGSFTVVVALWLVSAAYDPAQANDSVSEIADPHRAQLVTTAQVSLYSRSPEFNSDTTQYLVGECLKLDTLPSRLREIAYRDLGFNCRTNPLSVAEQSEPWLEGRGEAGPDSRQPQPNWAAAPTAWPPGFDHKSIGRRFFFTDLGTLGGTESFGYQVNDFEEIVGMARLAGDSATHAFHYLDGVMTDLYPLNSGRIRTTGPDDINNVGEIASGLVVSGVYVPAIFDFRSGTTEVLGTLGGKTSYGFSGVATAVNNLGDAAGYSYTNATNRHAFSYSDGALTDIGSLGGYSAAFDLNDAGTIVGFSSTSSSGGRAHAFLYSGDLMVDIDPLSHPLSESYARAINSNGDVVGQYYDPNLGVHRGFLYGGGVYDHIDFPESTSTVPLDVNDSRVVVGITTVPVESTCDYGYGPQPCIRYESGAFIFKDGKIANLNALVPEHTSLDLRWAWGINQSGQIVGAGENGDKFRAFLLTPARIPSQCMDGSWRHFGFSNQGECIKFVVVGN